MNTVEFFVPSSNALVLLKKMLFDINEYNFKKITQNLKFVIVVEI